MQWRGSLLPIQCCSTSCTLFTYFLQCLLFCLDVQILHNFLSLALRPTLPVKPGAKAVQNAHKISNNIFNWVLCDVDHLDGAALLSQKCLNVLEPETGKAVFMFNDNDCSRRISNQSSMRMYSTSWACSSVSRLLSLVSCLLSLDQIGMPIVLDHLYHRKRATCPALFLSTS